MANKIVLIDDFDQTTAAETVRFGLDGTDYLIDLNNTHAGELRELLRPYINAGRRATPPLKERKRGARPQNLELDMIRFWAGERGLKVSDRGRIPDNVMQAYRDANPQTKV